MTLKSNAKFEVELTLENDRKNMTDFQQSTRKSHWDFDGILLSKAKNV